LDLFNICEIFRTFLLTQEKVRDTVLILLDIGVWDMVGWLVDVGVLFLIFNWLLTTLNCSSSFLLVDFLISFREEDDNSDPDEISVPDENLKHFFKTNKPRIFRFKIIFD